MFTFPDFPQAREVVQTFHRPTVLPSGQKKGLFARGGKAFLLGHQAAAVTDVVTGEPVYIETSEKQQEESVLMLRISEYSSIKMILYVEKMVTYF